MAGQIVQPHLVQPHLGQQLGAPQLQPPEIEGKRLLLLEHLVQPCEIVLADGLGLLPGQGVSLSRVPLNSRSSFR